jgi:serine protease
MDARRLLTSHATHPILGALLGAALLLTPVATEEGRLQSPPRSLKRMLLEGPSRPVSAPDVIRARPPRRADRTTPYVPGHIVVKFAPDMTDGAMAALAADVGGRAVRRLHDADFVYVDIAPDQDPSAAAAALAGRPGVVYAEPDGRVFPLFRPNDTFYNLQWNLQKLDMERTWDINSGAKNTITVAVIDSGVAFLDQGQFKKAPELAGVPFVKPYDFVWDDEEPVDLDGHGTHVTGTIAQATNNSEGVAGIAFNVSIMPLKAIFGEWDEAFDAPYPYGVSTVSRAIRYAADNGAHIINMSIGSFVENTATREAMEYAIGKGVLIVAAAGNSGDEDNAPLYPAAYAKDLDGAIAVAAVDFDLRRSYYSNVNEYVEISAPGGDVNVDLNDDGYVDGVLQQTLDFDAVSSGVFDQFVYEFQQGTSMAAPHVAGFAALLMDQGVTNPAVVEAAIKKFATDIGPAGRDDETGHGLLNPRATIRGLGLRR